VDPITKIVTTMYRTNKQVFRNNAHFVLQKFYSIPIDEDDLILGCLQELIVKGNNFKSTPEYPLEKYLYSNIKYTMFSYCRSFTRKNNAILNNYIDFELMENFKSQTYHYKELNLESFTEIQKAISEDLYQGKLSIKDIAIKHTTTSNFVKKQIKEIRKNIIKQKDN
jgi:hypothetical protein